MALRAPGTVGQWIERSELEGRLGMSTNPVKAAIEALQKRNDRVRCQPQDPGRPAGHGNPVMVGFFPETPPENPS